MEWTYAKRKYFKNKLFYTLSLFLNINFSEESPVSSGYSVTDILHQQEGHQPLLYSGPYSGQNPTSEELYRSQVGI